MAGSAGERHPRGQGRRGAIGGTQGPFCDRRQVTRVPSGSSSALPRPFSRSCHLLPTRVGRRGDGRVGKEGCAHQRLPTDRTTLRRRLTPGLALVRSLPWWGTSTGPWPTCCRHWASAAPWVWPYSPRQRTRTAPGGVTCCSQRPMNYAIGKRIVRWVAWPPGALGPLFILEDDLLPITREQPPIGERSSAPVAGQVDQHPVPVWIALPDVHIPLRAAQSVEQILHRLLALALRKREVAVRQLLVDGRS
jgi:hypothetical protein